MSFGKKTDSKGLMARDFLSDSSSSTNTLSNVKQQRQKEAMQKLASNFKKKTSEKKQPDSWQNLIQNLLNSQRGKLPLLLAVEAGNQSMVRELLSAQTAEQLKVSKFSYKFIYNNWVRICFDISRVRLDKFIKANKVLIYFFV